MLLFACPLLVLSLAPQRIHIVVNPFGGGGAGLATLDAVTPIFEAAGIEVTKLITEYAGHAGEYARTVPLLDGFVGIGGDGTAHEIANGMMSREERVPIGIIPAGSGNTWALDLGLADAMQAAHAIARGSTTAVDVMAIKSFDGASVREYAINIAGFGMPAAVLEQANALRWLGSAQYELAGLVLIAAGKTRFGAALTIEDEDGAITTRRLDDFSFAQAQINMHMGSMWRPAQTSMPPHAWPRAIRAELWFARFPTSTEKVCFAPTARMNDGLLDLVLITRSGGIDILHANALARGASHVGLPFVEVIRCRRFELTPLRTPEGVDALINLDGELSGAAPFVAECVPRALDVFASRLNAEAVDTSADLEPQLVVGLTKLLGREQPER